MADEEEKQPETPEEGVEASVATEVASEEAAAAPEEAPAPEEAASEVGPSEDAPVQGGGEEAVAPASEEADQS